MKKYIGTKIVYATPMNADNALEKGYKIGKHTHEDGYEVIYKDGYKSWSPKEVFEKSYREYETYQDKLSIKKSELEKEAVNLERYRRSNSFQTINKEMKDLINGEITVILHLIDILNTKIKILNKGI